MNRPRAYTIAAVLLALSGLLGLLVELPNLARGTATGTEAPPFALTVVNFTIAILGFVAAYGVWGVQKWGVVLGIVVSGLLVLTSLPGILFAPALGMRLLAGLGVAWGAAMIVLLLRPAGAAGHATSSARFVPPPAPRR